jgi:hypothetical protein
MSRGSEGRSHYAWFLTFGLLLSAWHRTKSPSPLLTFACPWIGWLKRQPYGDTSTAGHINAKASLTCILWISENHHWLKFAWDPCGNTVVRWTFFIWLFSNRSSLLECEDLEWVDRDPFGITSIQSSRIVRLSAHAFVVDRGYKRYQNPNFKHDLWFDIRDLSQLHWPRSW